MEDLLKIAASGGGTTRCPKCNGGRTAEQSANVFPQGGRWWVKCHRASCGYCQPLDGSHMIPVTGKQTLRSYEGPVEALPDTVRDWLVDRYPLLLGTQVSLRLRWNPERGTLLLPIRTWAGRLAGWAERAGKPGDGSPLTPYTECGPDWRHKVKTWYQHLALKGSMAWLPSHQNGRAILVEDYLSALALHCQLSDRTRRPVAILGAQLNQQRISEMYHAGITDVLLALDADATSTAFREAARWGMAFDSFRVLPLDKDVKDMVQSDFAHLHERIT